MLALLRSQTLRSDMCWVFSKSDTHNGLLLVNHGKRQVELMHFWEKFLQRQQWQQQALFTGGRRHSSLVEVVLLQSHFVNFFNAREKKLTATAVVGNCASHKLTCLKHGQQLEVFESILDLFFSSTSLHPHPTPSPTSPTNILANPKPLVDTWQSLDPYPW